MTEPKYTEPLSIKRAIIYLSLFLLVLWFALWFTIEDVGLFIKNFSIAAGAGFIFLSFFMWILNFVVNRANAANASQDPVAIKKNLRFAQILLFVGVLIQLLMFILKKSVGKVRQL